MQELIGTLIVLLVMCGPVLIVFSMVGVLAAAMRSSQISREQETQENTGLRQDE